VPLAADQCRDARGTGFVEDVARDILYALRTCRRAPLAALTIVGTVALGLGLIAMAFTLYSTFFLRNDAVQNAAELVAVERPARARADALSFTRAEYEAMRRETGVFTDAVAINASAARVEGRLTRADLVTGNFFQVLGVLPSLGRALLPDDEGAGRPVIVLSHAGWRKLFQGDGMVIGRRMAINPMTDLVHISMLADGDQILNISAEVPAKNYAEFIALAKAKPGALYYGDAGPGGNQHLYLEYFKMLAGVDLTGVHYRGGGPLMPDLLANRVQLSLNAPSVVLPYIEKGQLRPLAIVAAKRNPKLPNVPTVAEVGLKPMEACSNWLGLHAPKGTPDAIVQKLHKAMVETMQSDTVKKGMETLNVYPVVSTPAEFSARIARDSALFAKVAKDANVRAE